MLYKTLLTFEIGSPERKNKTQNNFVKEEHISRCYSYSNQASGISGGRDKRINGTESGNRLTDMATFLT
jgi:hypothetical protein